MITSLDLLGLDPGPAHGLGDDARAQSTAGTEESAPWKAPMGVRTALTMTASLMDAAQPTPGSSSRSRRPTRRWGC